MALMTKDCPECGHSNSQAAKRCTRCKADLSDVPAGRH